MFLLQSLSSQLVISTNPGDYTRQEAIDGLLVDLKKINSSPISSQPKWDKFVSAVQMAFTDNSALIGRLMEGKMNGFVSIMEQYLSVMNQKIEASELRLAQLARRSVAKKKRQIPVKRRVYEPPERTPVRVNKYMDRSPVTPMGR